MNAETRMTRAADDGTGRSAGSTARVEAAPSHLRAAGMPFDAVLDQMADGIILADERWRLRWMNPAAARMLGRAVADESLDEWCRAHHVVRTDGTPYPAAEMPLARALAHGDVVEGEEWCVRRPDGALVHLLGSAAPLSDAEGRRLGAVLVMRDVTERVRLAQALDAQTSAKERFLAHVSHELRAPVHTVLGYSALLSDGDAGPLPAVAAEMVGRIERSARHLMELVDDLLDISRMEAGMVALDNDEVSLSGLLHDTLAALKPQARAKGLVLELRMAEVSSLRTDARRVRQIVLNLLANAVKWTDRGGVTVALEHRPPERVAVHVVDTGVGIAAEDQERVFEEFVQLGAARGGTGLGLAISRGLARLLGGDLTLSSAPGRGSCFTLTLPVDALPDCRVRAGGRASDGAGGCMP